MRYGTPTRAASCCFHVRRRVRSFWSSGAFDATASFACGLQPPGEVSVRRFKLTTLAKESEPADGARKGKGSRNIRCPCHARSMEFLERATESERPRASSLGRRRRQPPFVFPFPLSAFLFFASLVNGNESVLPACLCGGGGRRWSGVSGGAPVPPPPSPRRAGRCFFVHGGCPGLAPVRPRWRARTPRSPRRILFRRSAQVRRRLVGERRT
jgi:hypothetical protein